MAPRTPAVADEAVIVSQRSLATLQSRLQQFVHNLNTATESGTFLQSVDAIQEIVRDITTCASMQQTELSSLLATLNRNRAAQLETLSRALVDHRGQQEREAFIKEGEEGAAPVDRRQEEDDAMVESVPDDDNDCTSETGVDCVDDSDQDEDVAFSDDLYDDDDDDVDIDDDDDDDDDDVFE